MPEQDSNNRFHSRAEYVEYRKFERRRKNYWTVRSLKEFMKPVVNPYERKIRERLDGYCGAKMVFIVQGMRGNGVEGK